MIQEKPLEGQVRKPKKFPFRISSKRYLYIIGIFTLLGIGGGLAYYWFIGCRTGGCAITSSPYLSMIFGGLIGYLATDFVVKSEPQP
ncbi:MAG TPA: hypothetical protein VLH61_09815 [Bacteroidales bacterium]|nr:hypothetical protein [Bacteroidales bacterium]